MALGVDQSEGHTPRDADDDPSVDAQMFPEAFDVGDQMAGGVGRQVRVGIGGQRAAAAASPLVEQDRPVTLRVEIALRAWSSAGSGTAVEEHRRRPRG